jgi:hypothetical protein
VLLQPAEQGEYLLQAVAKTGGKLACVPYGRNYTRMAAEFQQACLVGWQVLRINVLVG